MGRHLLFWSDYDTNRDCRRIRHSGVRRKLDTAAGFIASMVLALRNGRGCNADRSGGEVIRPLREINEYAVPAFSNDGQYIFWFEPCYGTKRDRESQYPRYGTLKPSFPINSPLPRRNHRNTERPWSSQRIAPAFHLLRVSSSFSTSFGPGATHPAWNNRRSTDAYRNGRLVGPLPFHQLPIALQ